MVSSLAAVTATVLAGGLGTRLRDVVADRPKVLAEVRGRPFLAYILDQLVEAGLRRVVLCTGYLGDQVEAIYGHSYRNLTLLYSREPSPLGTGGALRRAMDLFASDSMLVLNGDSFCDADLAAFWAWHCDQDSVATLLLTHVPDTRPYGRVVVDTDGFVRSFEEKAAVDGSGTINAGVYLLSRHLLLSIPAHTQVSLEREVFPTWVGRGLRGYRTHAPFLDIGTPEAYASADQFFAS